MVGEGRVNDSLSKGARGDLYEANYRQEICAAILHNRLLSGARCAENQIKRTADFEEQIDLLIYLKPLLIVAEVKCWLFPADSVERFRYLNKLKEAANQAKRKANALRGKQNVAWKALGMPPECSVETQVVPLVVTNQAFGVGLNMDGCIVTDAEILKGYLREGAIITGMISGLNRHERVLAKTTYYENEAQAAKRFGREFSDPYVQRRVEERITWTTVLLPAPLGEPTFFAAPRLADVSEWDKEFIRIATAGSFA